LKTVQRPRLLKTFFRISATLDMRQAKIYLPQALASSMRLSSEFMPESATNSARPRFQPPRDDHRAAESAGFPYLQVLTTMATEGIRLVVCMFALKVMGLDSASLPKDVVQVPSGWISSIGRQKKGYVMVPVY